MLLHIALQLAIVVLTSKRVMSLLQLVLVFVTLCMHWADGTTGDVYSIGISRYDITGPAVEINMVCGNPNEQ